MAHGDGYNWGAPDSITRIVSNRPLAIRPNLRSFHLDPRTNATDLVSQSYIYAMGLLASERLVHALRDHTVQAHAAYPAEVIHHGRILRYFWLHMTEELEPRIDYGRSSFLVTDAAGGVKTGTPAAMSELRGICLDLIDRAAGRLSAGHVTFITGTQRYDLFCLRLTALTWFVSDGLAAELKGAWAHRLRSSSGRCYVRIRLKTLKH